MKRKWFWQAMAAGWVIFGMMTWAYAQKAVVATAAADYSGGAHSVIDMKTGIALNKLLPTSTTDLTVTAYQNFFFRIERYQKDNVAKFDINAPAVPIWQFSTNDTGEEGSSNPYALIFVNLQKAFLLRYGKTKAWIVNPSAASQAGFKTGELDLGAYADSDGVPEMACGVIVKDKLFIALQRLNRNDGWSPSNPSYVAVFDVAAHSEINTSPSNSGNLKGIALPIRNPQSIQYVPESDTIYIQGSGGYAASWSGKKAQYTGGIAAINPNTYQVRMIVDDGDDTSHPYGNISGMSIVSPTKGYFIGYDGWGDNTLYGFNPSTGDVSGAVSDALKHKNIAGMESGAYADQDGRLWICNGTDAEVIILNTTDHSLVNRISTELNPLKVAFTATTTTTSLVTTTTTSSTTTTTIASVSDDDGGGCFIDMLRK